MGARSKCLRINPQAERESQLKQTKTKLFFAKIGRFSVLELLALSFSSRPIGGLRNPDNFLTLISSRLIGSLRNLDIFLTLIIAGLWNSAP